MNIKKQLEDTHSKESSNQIIAFIEKYPEQLNTLMDCFYYTSNNYKIPQRAAYTASLFFQKYPDKLIPFISDLVRKLNQEKVRGSLKRNILRILQNAEIPDDLRGILYEKCYHYVCNPNEKIAVRAFSMTILYNIATVYTDLKNELKQEINMVLAEPTSSPGIQARGKAIIKLLNR